MEHWQSSLEVRSHRACKAFQLKAFKMQGFTLRQLMQPGVGQGCDQLWFQKAASGCRGGSKWQGR